MGLQLKIHEPEPVGKGPRPCPQVNPLGLSHRANKSPQISEGTAWTRSRPPTSSWSSCKITKGPSDGPQGPLQTRNWGAIEADFAELFIMIVSKFVVRWDLGEGIWLEEGPGDPRLENTQAVRKASAL